MMEEQNQIEEEIALKQETKVDLGKMVVVTALIAACFSIGMGMTASLASAYTVSNPAAVSSSLLSRDKLTQGDVVNLVVGYDTMNNVSFRVFDGGRVNLTLKSIDQASQRAVMQLKYYDADENLVMDREVSYGVADSGFEVEVLKVSDGRATVTVPYRPGQGF